jgi:hypothetical protein
MVLRSEERLGALRGQAGTAEGGDDALADQLDDLKRWADDLRVALIVQMQRFVSLLDQIDRCSQQLAAASGDAPPGAADQPAD